jgi:predicted regulator of Ras-like GTPase activity (Roadblock/LC7/MglB family)
LSSPFEAILHRALARIPGALGGSFAAADGETVDYASEIDRSEWALITAHYGVVLRHVQTALNTFHFGEAELVIVSHRDRDVVMHHVTDGYFAMVVLAHPGSLAHAMTALSEATAELRQEMS